MIVRSAAAAGVEDGRRARVDCTVVESNIHEPTDSGLLWDGVGKLTDLMEQARELLGGQVVVFSNHQRRAKRRHREISTAKSNEDRQKPYRDLLGVSEQVIDQTRRRVLLGESVPAGEKIVSIFEVHTDIIRKDRRETLYGHKICLTAGASSMILDCVVLEGNPADSTLTETMVDRQREIFGRSSPAIYSYSPEI